MESLGFTEDLDWKTEEEEKKALWDRIQMIKKRAEQSIQAQEGDGTGSAPA